MPLAHQVFSTVCCLFSLTLTATDCTAAVRLVGKTAVAVVGEIVQGDANQLAEALDERRRAGIGDLTVLLNSPGGTIGEGFAAAVAIGKAEANTVVGENETCASACFLLFLAGNKKSVFPGARIGVHSARTAGKEDEDDRSLATSAELARMYEQLGLPATVIAKSVTTPPDEIYWLTEADLRSMNVLFMSASIAPTPNDSQTQDLPVGRRTVPRRQFSVEGLAPGTEIDLESPTYKAYSCKPSEQYPPSIRCHSEKMDGEVLISKTIYHSPKGIVSYVNKAVAPAFFNKSDVDAEIARLSNRHGSPSHIYRSPERPGVPKAVIATWGAIELHPLSSADLALLAQSRDRGHGVLVDFLGDFAQSAKLQLPVYSLDGGEGFVWIASFDKSGKGKLRFFAAEPSQMKQRTSANESSRAPKGPLDGLRDYGRDLAICQKEAAEMSMLSLRFPRRGLIPWLVEQGEREEEKNAVINGCMAERGHAFHFPGSVGLP